MLFSLGSIDLLAQNDFRNGFIIKNNGETVTGLIDFKGYQKTAKRCIFKSNINSPEQIFTPDDISSYGFVDSKLLTSKEINTGSGTERRFLEYLISGKVNAYYYREDDGSDHYFIEDESNKLSELKNTKEELFIDHPVGEINMAYGKYTRELKEYIGVLKLAFIKSPKVCKEAENISLSQKSLIRLVQDYHKDVYPNEDYITYEKLIIKSKSSIGPVVGLNIISISEASDLLSAHDYLHDSDFGFVFYPSIGLSYKVNLSFINERVFFQYEGTYSRFTLKTSNTYEDPLTGTISNNDIALTQNMFRNIGLIKYEFPTGIIRPTFHFGGFLSYFLKTDYYRDVLEEYTYGGTYAFNTDENPFEKFDYGVNLGFGFISIIFNKKEFFLDFRYQRGFGLLHGMNTNIYSANFGFQFGN